MLFHFLLNTKQKNRRIRGGVWVSSYSKGRWVGLCGGGRGFTISIMTLGGGSVAHAILILYQCVVVPGWRNWVNKVYICTHTLSPKAIWCVQNWKCHFSMTHRIWAVAQDPVFRMTWCLDEWSVDAILKISIIFEQISIIFEHFALGSANYVPGPVWNSGQFVDTSSSNLLGETRFCLPVIPVELQCYKSAVVC